MLGQGASALTYDELQGLTYLQVRHFSLVMTCLQNSVDSGIGYVSAATLSAWERAGQGQRHCQHLPGDGGRLV